MPEVAGRGAPTRPPEGSRVNVAKPDSVLAWAEPIQEAQLAVEPSLHTLNNWQEDSAKRWQSRSLANRGEAA
jgi:hypothetical protein